jgi:signal transduction histidine kinase
MRARRDPTNDSRLEVAAEAVRKADERATAGLLALEMIHEIKNPLEALGHLTYLALHEADDPERVRKYMRLAEEQMSLLRAVATQTLGFARSTPARREIESAALVQAALRIHQRALEAKQIHLVTRFPPDIVAKVYPSEILQVLSNLIVNALEALPPAGNLHLRVRKAQGKVYFLIADSGHGIPPEHVDLLFQPFFTTKEDRGNGLGLALSKKIVERHGGKIRIRSSVRPGKSGTIFRISLAA